MKPLADYVVDRSRDPVLAPGERPRLVRRYTWASVVVVGLAVFAGFVLGVVFGTPIGCGGCGGVVFAILGGGR